MEQNELAVKCWVMFCMNYPDVRGVIKWICEHTDKMWLYDHLLEKFDSCYSQGKNYGAMTLFYCDLDLELRKALVDYAIKVYAPTGCLLTEEQKSLLGI